MRTPTHRAIATALIVFVAYAATTWLGLQRSVADSIVMAIWAPAAIALVALTYLGTRAWPVVFFAAIVGNLVSDTSLGLSVGIAAGNTIAAIVGATMLRRGSFRTGLDRGRDIALLALVAALSSVIGATAGVTQLWELGHITTLSYAQRWLLWWSGDVTGILLAGPFLFTAITFVTRRPRIRPLRIAEFIVALTALGTTAAIVFTYPELRFPAMLLPLWGWAALRFRAFGSASATLLVATLAVNSIVHGTVRFSGLDLTETVHLSQALATMVGLCALIIGAALTESESRRLRVEELLRSEQEVATRLRTIDDMKDRLLAAVSHELRTPLTSILALSVLLRQRHAAIESDKLEEMLDRLVVESRRLDTLLTDLLDLERLRLGMVEPRYERVDVPNLVRAALDRFTIDQRTTRLDLQHVQIDADAAKLDRIVDNLLGNAFKHTPLDGCVTVTVRQVDDGALITVEDQGDGVPDEMKETVFEPFNRGGSSLADVPGTGIGLSLVAHFTELHGGRAWVEDRDGGGASFRVYLPGSRAR